MSARATRSRAVVLVDQVMSGVSNVLAVVLVARATSSAEFGRFAVAFTALTVALTLSRAYFGTRVSLAPDPSSARHLTRDLTGSLVVIAPAVALGMLGVSLIAVGTGSMEILLIVAAATPIVLVQDIVRYGASAADRPVAALASDTVWVGVMLLPFVLGTSPSPTSAVLLWACGAVAALLVALVVAGVSPSVPGGIAQLRSRHHVGESLTVANVIAQGGVMWIALLASWFIGPSAAGALRGAATAMGPVNVLFAFTALGLTPLLVRRARSTDVPFCAATAATLGALTALWGAVLLVLPDSVGNALLGDSWPGIRAILPWTVTEYVLLGVAVSAVLGLKVRHRARQIVVQRAAAGVVTFVVGALVAVAVGQTWAIAAVLVAAAALSAVVGWAQLAPRPDPAVDPAAVAASTGGAR